MVEWQPFVFCESSSVAEHQLPKLDMGVRFPSLALAICLFILAGCATVPKTASLPKPPSGLNGFYHRVEKGQTLWGISKQYNIDLDQLVEINRITDKTALEVGQMVFISSVLQEEVKKINLNLIKAEDNFIWPLKGRQLGNFGEVINGRVNKGINIVSSGANTIVFAARSGKVVFCAPSFKSYGSTVIIDHGDGFLTVYAFKAELLVKAGDSVLQGASIARLAGQRQLYFELRKGHIPQNPTFFLPR